MLMGGRSGFGFVLMAVAVSRNKPTQAIETAYANSFGRIPKFVGNDAHGTFRNRI